MKIYDKKDKGLDILTYFTRRYTRIFILYSIFML